MEMLSFNVTHQTKKSKEKKKIFIPAQRVLNSRTGPGIPSPPSPSRRVEIRTPYSVLGSNSSMVKLHTLPQLKWVTMPAFSSFPWSMVLSQILYHIMGGSPLSPLALLHGSQLMTTSLTPGPSFAMFGGWDNTGNSIHTKSYVSNIPFFVCMCHNILHFIHLYQYS